MIRPRNTYIHLRCGAKTRVGIALATIFAEQPGYYSSTFCSKCRNYYAIGVDGEFVWKDTDEKLGV